MTWKTVRSSSVTIEQCHFDAFGNYEKRSIYFSLSGGWFQLLVVCIEACTILCGFVNFFHEYDKTEINYRLRFSEISPAFCSTSYTSCGSEPLTFFTLDRASLARWLLIRLTTVNHYYFIMRCTYMYRLALCWLLSQQSAPHPPWFEPLRCSANSHYLGLDINTWLK